MFVMTVDQRRSRRDVDRVDDLLADLANTPMTRPFQRTAGDEIQGVTADTEVVVDRALDLVRRGHWSVGIGVGDVEQPLPEQTRAGRGPAYEAARRAVERAKSMPGRIAVEGAGQDSADAEAMLTLLALLVMRRSAEGHTAVDLVRGGLNQSEAADRLQITKQAMSQRLAAAGWQAEEPARTTATRLLDRADQAEGGT